MRSLTILVVARGVILAALLVLLVVSLGSSLLRERADQLVDRPLRGVQPDPGIRVLLADRANERQLHQQISLVTLQPAVLTIPDDPDGRVIDLRPQQRVDILANTMDGIVVTGPGIEDLALNSLSVAVMPARTNQSADGSPAVFEAADQQPVFAIGNRRYRGNLLVSRVNPRELAVVNVLPIETWLEGVLQAELADTWPRQVLESLAIAARSYAYSRHRSRELLPSEPQPWTISDSYPDPRYDGTGDGGRLIDLAVAGTRGLVLTHLSTAFPAYYHPASGGVLASIDTFDANQRTADGALPLDEVYVSRPDPFHADGVALRRWEATHGRRDMVIDHATLRDRLITAPDIRHADGWVYRLEVERGPGDPSRIRKVLLHTVRDVVEVDPERFRDLIGRSNMRSMVWTSDSPRNQTGQNADNSPVSRWSVTTIGRGHGVGMALVSAAAMADQGYSTRQILSFFYLETDVEQRW